MKMRSKSVHIFTNHISSAASILICELNAVDLTPLSDPPQVHQTENTNSRYRRYEH